MRRAVGIALLAALALVAAGCGGTSSSSSSSSTPLELVSQAVSKTTTAESAQVRMTISETIGGLGPLDITAGGVVDNTTHSARMTMDMSPIAALAGSAAGDPDAWKGDVIAIGSKDDVVEYMHIPAFSKLIPGAKPWIKFDLNELGKQSGVNFSQLLQSTGTQDPTQALAVLKSVGDVKEVGSAQVAGVDTTEYAGTLDAQKIAKKYGDNGFGKLFEQTGLKSVPVRVWVDGDGYVRKLQESFSMTVPGAGAMDMKLSYELSDFGGAVVIEAPPADQVTDLLELIKKK